MQLSVKPVVDRYVHSVYMTDLPEYELAVEAIATSQSELDDAAEAALLEFMEYSGKYFGHMDDCLRAVMAAVTGKGSRDEELMDELFPATIAFTLAKVM